MKNFSFIFSIPMSFSWMEIQTLIDHALKTDSATFTSFSVCEPSQDMFMDRKLVSELKAGEKTKISDLALVCANCHRMLYKNGNKSLDDLRQILESNKDSLMSAGLKK